MNISISEKLNRLTGYAFAEIDRKVAELKARGIQPIDFGTGDPTEPTPTIVREAVKRAVDLRASAGYPSYIGAPDYRAAVAAWTKRRFNVALDPETEICSTIGAKEAVFHLPFVLLNPGDVVLAPNPGYPPYTRGAHFAGVELHALNLRAEKGFLPDLASIPGSVLQRAKLLWINYPNNPTGAMAPRSFLEEVAAFGQKHGIVIASDEPYTENYYGSEKPISMLEVAREGVIVFQSLSKRSCMTGYRVGWVAGDQRIIQAFKKMKTNIDSGTPSFIQDAAIVAIADEAHVEELRNLYRQKRDLIVDAFIAAGLPECRPAATLYVWQRIPRGYTSVSFAEKLLDPEIGVVATPGAWISEEGQGENPGDGYVRLALVPSLQECRLAARRIARLSSST